MSRPSSRWDRPTVWHTAGFIAVAALAGLLVATAAQAQNGTITGTVRDRADSAPVPAAQVMIVGTTRGTITTDDGKFRIAGAPLGPVQLRVARIGYAAQTRTVTVPANDVANVDFTLTQTQITLDQVVVEATGNTESQRQTGMAVGTIQADSIQKAAVSTFSDLI